MHNETDQWVFLTRRWHADLKGEGESPLEVSTYKVQEAAADFMMSVRVRVKPLFYHGQEVFVDGQDLLNVEK